MIIVPINDDDIAAADHMPAGCALAVIGVAVLVLIFVIAFPLLASETQFAALPDAFEAEPFKSDPRFQLMRSKYGRYGIATISDNEWLRIISLSKMEAAGEVASVTTRNHRAAHAIFEHPDKVIDRQFDAALTTAGRRASWRRLGMGPPDGTWKNGHYYRRRGIYWERHAKDDWMTPPPALGGVPGQ